MDINTFNQNLVNAGIKEPKMLIFWLFLIIVGWIVWEEVNKYYGGKENDKQTKKRYRNIGKGRNNK
jgi:hypothetical protein